MLGPVMWVPPSFRPEALQNGLNHLPYLNLLEETLVTSFRTFIFPLAFPYLTLSAIHISFLLFLRASPSP